MILLLGMIISAGCFLTYKISFCLYADHTKLEIVDSAQNLIIKKLARHEEILQYMLEGKAPDGGI